MKENIKDNYIAKIGMHCIVGVHIGLNLISNRMGKEERKALKNISKVSLIIIGVALSASCHCSNAMEDVPRRKPVPLLLASKVVLNILGMELMPEGCVLQIFSESDNETDLVFGQTRMQQVLFYSVNDETLKKSVCIIVVTARENSAFTKSLQGKVKPWNFC